MVNVRGDYSDTLLGLFSFHTYKKVPSLAVATCGLQGAFISRVLDDHGLAVALQRYVADYSKTHKIAVDLTLDGAGTCDLPPAVQLAALRIVQEALTNVVEHSAAIWN